MQNPLGLIYPDRCVICGDLVEDQGALCATCWGGTPFLDGLGCRLCAAPLIGEDPDGGALCDDCLCDPPPWAGGVSAIAYDGHGRRLVMTLKHGDRPDLARPAAGWIAARAGGVLGGDPLIVPVPLHWSRLLRRRYNQAALIARELGRITGAEVLTGALCRTRRTVAQERMTREDRMANLRGAIAVSPRWRGAVEGRAVVLVDDVMTSGATLRACSIALGTGPEQVRVATLARVVKRP